MNIRNAQKPERMVITRVFDASRELVWKAWTDPACAMRWWGPQGFTCPVCHIDFRVGGKFLFCMRSPDGTDLWTGGEYLEIVPYEKIVLSLYPTDPDGNRIDPAQVGLRVDPIDDSNDVVLFEDLGNGQTRLTLLGNETMQSATESGQVEGWNQILDKFAGVLAESAPTT